MPTKKSVHSLDNDTLEALIKEASRNYKEENKLFEESDSPEAMHAAEQWSNTVAWLSEKLEKIPK